MSEATDAPTQAADGEQTERQVPAVTELTYGQYAGTHCVWCAEYIPSRARLVGVAEGRSGIHVLDAPVYAGPCCP